MSTRLARLLIRAKLVQPGDVERASELPATQPLAARLAALGVASEERIAETLAARLDLPYVGLAAPTIGTEALDLVPLALAERHAVFPVAVEDGTVQLAMADPLDVEAIRDVEFRSGLRVRPAVATPARIRNAIARGYVLEQTVAPLRGAPRPTEPTADGILDVAANAETTPVVRMVNLLVREGIEAAASDIHVEPGDSQVVVRNRVDGVLRGALALPLEVHAGLVSRLKILAHLDIAERRRPQDGRIRVRHGDRTLDVRVSTLPTHRGEKVVLRLLDPDREMLALEHLGLEPAQRAIVEAALDQPQGTILVTGPTGSGKTSTLYAALSRLKSPGINIVTLENPVEFQIAGVNQVHVHERAGLTFAASLRAIVRQDPDVIMVGEIRDPETAEVAFQAALTGHLVLSTLHTNSASAAVTRLLDLGVEPFLVASSVTLVIAQRLLRRLCPHCRQAGPPSPEEGTRLRLEDGPVFRATGCERCHGAGFAGRVGVFELLPVDARVRELIGQRAPEAALAREASARGLPSLLEAAAARVRAGATSPDEVFRAILCDESTAERCPGCAGPIEPRFTVCPACATLLQPRCAACGQDLQAAWKVCPYCSAPAKPAS